MQQPGHHARPGVNRLSENKKLDSRRIEELYAQGRTDGQIAQALGVKRETVCAWRVERRIPSNDVKQRKDLSNLEKEAIMAREMGLTYGQYKALGYRPIEPLRKRSKKRVLIKT